MALLHSINPWRRQALIIAVIALLLLGLLLANAHLVYVAVSTQPDCVAHTRSGAVQAGSGSRVFQAAKSAC